MIPNLHPNQQEKELQEAVIVSDFSEDDQSPNSPNSPDSTETKSEQKKKDPQYNWNALRIEFMQGPWSSIEEFKKDKDMASPSKDAYFNAKMGDWEKEKSKAVTQVVKSSLNGLIEITPELLAMARQRQADIGRMLQRKGLEALKVLEPKNADDARKMIVSGLQEERAALGLSEKGGQSSSLTQVNVNLPKTKFDKIIHDEDFAGILKFIAEVKRERTRRTGESTSSQSKATTK